MKQRLALPKLVASALALIVLLALLAQVTPADSTTTYDFSGTLSISGKVTGQFTLDAANFRVTSFQFTTPLGDISAATSTANVYTYTPAYSPAKDFVEIEILPTVSNPGLNLNLQADLSKLTPASFYPGAFYLFPDMQSAPSQLMPPLGCSDW